MPLHSCDQRYSAGHEWRFWCGGSDRVGPAALLSRLPLTAPSTTDVAYPCDTSDSLLFRLGMSWKKLGRVILVDSRLTLPARNKSPACTVSDSRFGWRGDLHRRKRESRTPYSALFWPRPLPTENLRLNAKFRNVLSERAEIGVAIVTTEAWIDVSSTQVIADLSSKAMRRLF